MKRICWLVLFVFLGKYLAAQCDIKGIMHPDGTMYYHGERVLFYNTSEIKLSGSVITDKENYFLSLRPFPFPPKGAGEKLKDKLEIKLANDSTYILEHYDSRYNNRDTSFSMVYLFPKKEIRTFLENEVVEVKINLGGAAPIVCVFRLHRDAVKNELACFMQKGKTF